MEKMMDPDMIDNYKRSIVQYHQKSPSKIFTKSILASLTSFNFWELITAKNKFPLSKMAAMIMWPVWSHDNTEGTDQSIS